MQRFYYLICQSTWCQNASKLIYQKGAISFLWDTKNVVYCKFDFHAWRWIGRWQKSSGLENRPTPGMVFPKHPVFHFAPCSILPRLIYTWSWHQTSEGQGYHCISCESNCNHHHRKWHLCRRPWDTHHRGLCQTSEAHRASAQRPGRCFCPCWPEVPFLQCWSSRGSASLAVPPAIRCWWPGHLYVCFPTDILYETLGKWFPEPLWKVRSSGKSLGEHPL